MEESLSRFNIEQIAQRCDKVRWRGQDSFTACCPAHDDRNPSMSVTERDGKVLVHCHSGCPQDAVLDALGMCERKRDWVPPIKPRLKIYKPTTDYAATLWSAAGDGVETHPYAVRKRITHGFGARRGAVSGKMLGKDADCIIVPNRDWEGQLTGVECINADGVKQTFGSKGLALLGYPEDSLLIHICEGWATAWALSQLFPQRFGCVVAFGKSRLETYARDAQVRFRGTIAVHEDSADNRDVWDLWATGEGETYSRRVRRSANV